MQDWSWFRTTGQSGTGWGFSAAETASSARVPLTQPISVINEAKHRVVQRLPEHMCSWGAVELGWGEGEVQEAQPLNQALLLSNKMP